MLWNIRLKSFQVYKPTDMKYLTMADSSHPGQLYKLNIPEYLTRTGSSHSRSTLQMKHYTISYHGRVMSFPVMCHRRPILLYLTRTRLSYFWTTLQMRPSAISYHVQVFIYQHYKEAKFRCIGIFYKRKNIAELTR